MEKFEEFLLKDSIALQATQSLKTSALILLEVDSKKYFFERTNEGPKISNSHDGKPDFTFLGNLNELCSQKHESIGTFGIALSKAIIEGKIQLKAHIGPLGFLQKGYLAMVTKGGGEFVSFLTKRGVSLTDIRKIFGYFKS